MKTLRLFLAALLLLPFAAGAQPVCIPGVYGETLDFAAPKRSDAGWRIVWVCGKDGYAIPQYLACVHGTCSEQALRDAIFTAVMSSDPTASMKASWAKMVTLNCVTATDAGRVVCDQAKADAVALMNAFIERQNAPAPEVWTVAKNSTFTTRPTYAFVNGVRATVAAAERVAVGAPCDPKVGVVTTSTTGSYLGVLGRVDRVSLCRK
jgi:hypothetical protein